MRGIPRRACAGLLALWFLAGGVAHAAGAHHCPHHDTLPASAEARAHPAPGHSQGSHAPAAHSAAARSAGDDTSRPAGEHGPCTCVGQCHAGSTPTLPASAAPSPDAAGHADPASTAAPAPPARAALVPFALPWGNAPPVS